MSAFTVAIDGPVAAGKSTIGRLLAQRISALFFDTGILYRAVAHSVLEQGVDPDDDKRVADVASRFHAELREAGGESRLIVSDRDITDELRSPAIDRALPAVSANPAVREHLLDTQRKIVRGRRAIVVGRDIGTVIFPDADLKVYLDADPEIRATRRYEELRDRGIEIDRETVYRDLLARDERDRGRALAPLQVAEDAVIVDASNRDVEAVIELIVELIAERGGRCCT
ncbi:MAG: (d)CMP kinase [Thermomicrobiales bacterium]